MDKSYVTLEQNVCQICGKPFDTGAILLDKRLKDRFDHKTVTGYGICPDDQAKIDDGFLALVEVNEPENGRKNLKQEEADRTGNIAYIKRHVAKEMFNINIPDNLPLLFVDGKVIAMLESMVAEA